MRVGSAEVGIVLGAQIDLERVRAQPAEIAEPRDICVAIPSLRKEIRVLQLLPQRLQADGKLVRGGRPQPVVPDELPAACVRAAVERAVAQVGAVIGAFAKGQAAGPSLDRMGLPVSLRHAQVLRGLMGIGRRTGCAVVIQAAAGAVDEDTHFVLRRDPLDQVARDAFVAIAIGIRIGFRRETRVDGRKAARIEARQRDVESCSADLAAVSSAQLRRPARTRRDLRTRGRGAVAAPGEDLDHAADPAGTVEAGNVAADDLDALDFVEHDVLDRRSADRGVLHTHAVDDDQGLGAAAAAHEQAGDRADTAVLGVLEPGLPLQQRRQIHRLRVADVFPGKDRGVRDRVAQRLLGARSGDDDSILCGGGLR